VSWKQVPLGYCAAEVRRKNLGGQEQNLLSLSYGNVVRKDITSSEGLLPESFDTYNVVESGDTVLRLTDLQNDQRSLRVGLVQERGIITSAYVSICPGREMDPRFLNYFLKHLDFRKEFYALGAGVRQSLKYEELRGLRVPRPRLTTQRAIADYLDTETARIDALIAKKQQMIELMEERRQLFVRKAVTGGLRENRPADRLGLSDPYPIPSTWRFIRARFLCDIATGNSDTDEGLDEGPFPFFVRSQTPLRSSRYLFDGEAVLTAGDGAGVGKVFHHYTGRFDAHQRVYVLHNFRAVSGRFFFYVFSTFFAESALDGSAKSTVDSVRRHMISEMLVPVPPLDEQEHIVMALERFTRANAETITGLQRQLELLRERRQALITAAVMGELEIPGVAA
jgi:type I restriction enzyme S subunit